MLNYKSMQYIYSKKMHYQPELLTHKVIVLEEDSALRSMYCKYITEAGYLGLPIKTHEEILAAVVEHVPVALVFNPIYQGELLTNVLNRLRKIAPEMHLVSIGFSVTDAQMRELMKLGVKSHINRMFSTPRDVVEILKNLI